MRVAIKNRGQEKFALPTLQMRDKEEGKPLCRSMSLSYKNSLQLLSLLPHKTEITLLVDVIELRL